MSSALIAAAALVEMAKVEMRPFEFPADWSEQVKACPECQRYKGHPIQRISYSDDTVTVGDLRRVAALHARLSNGPTEAGGQ